jgi:hypothetical protein
MPYIGRYRRKELLEETIHNGPLDAGELNFVLSTVIASYVIRRNLSYAACNDVVGALDSCKEEFRRRVINPYEDKKIKENGDLEEYRELGFKI